MHRRLICSLMLAAGLAVPASAPAADRSLSVTVGPFVVSCTSTGQVCSPPATGTVNLSSGMRVKQLAYTNAGSHCSDVRVSVLVDGRGLASTGFLGPGGMEVTTGLDKVLGRGKHTIEVFGIGRVSGCNTDGLGSWGGSVRLSGERTQVDKVALTFDPGRVAGDELAPARGSVSIKEEKGDPVTDQLVRFEPPLARFNPAAFVCDRNGNGIWPRVSSTGLDLTSFEQVTDDEGRIPFSVWLGDNDADWLLRAAEPDATETAQADSARALATRAGSRAAFPDSFAEFLQGAAAQTASFTPASKDVDLVQREIMDWLGTLRTNTGGVGAILEGLVYMPIQSMDAAKNPQGGVALVPGAERGALFNYLIGGSTRPDDAIVIDARRASVSTGLSGKQQPLPKRLPSLQEWEEGGFVPIREETNDGKPTTIGVPSRGRASFGILGAGTFERIALSSFIYPAPSTRMADFFLYRKCIADPLPGGLMVDVRSPVRILARDAQGLAVGRDAAGEFVYDAPDAAVRIGAKGEPDGLILPAAPWALELRGTGAGPATVIVTPAGSAAVPSVFTFRARKGATGALALTGAGAARTLRFGGRTVRAKRGVGLRVSGLPRTLKGRRTRTLRLRVRDQFGDAVPGALVTAVAGRATSRGLADARGRARLVVTAGRRGRVRFAVSAPGFRTLRASRRVG